MCELRSPKEMKKPPDVAIKDEIRLSYDLGSPYGKGSCRTLCTTEGLNKLKA